MKVCHRYRRLILRLVLAVLALPATAGTISNAQAVDLELEEDAEVAQPQALRAWVMSDDQFDQWVFGGPRNSHAGRSKLDARLTLQIDDVSRMCNISEDQKKKLFLAGHGDIKRFFEQVEEKRKKFDKVKHDQNKMSEIYQELMPLQTMLNSGLFGEGSIYGKTMRRILGEEQDERYQKAIQEKFRFRYRARIELAIAQLDQSVGFRDDQRHKLVEFLVNETQPPTRFGPYDYYFVLYQASKLGEARLKTMLNERQWTLLDRQLNQGRGIERFLRTQGLLPPIGENQPRRPGVVGDLPTQVFATPPDAGNKSALAQPSKGQILKESKP